jgi:hypothetical protein
MTIPTESGWRLCKDCREEFELPLGKKIFYDTRSLICPVRCKRCRAANRAANIARGEGRE